MWRFGEGRRCGAVAVPSCGQTSERWSNTHAGSVRWIASLASSAASTRERIVIEISDSVGSAFRQGDRMRHCLHDAFALFEVLIYQCDGRSAIFGQARGFQRMSSVSPGNRRRTISLKTVRYPTERCDWQPCWIDRHCSHKADELQSFLRHPTRNGSCLLDFDVIASILIVWRICRLSGNEAFSCLS